MICNKCGADNAEDANFCIKCGDTLAPVPQESQAPEQIAASGDGPSVQPQQTVQAETPPTNPEIQAQTEQIAAPAATVVSPVMQPQPAQIGVPMQPQPIYPNQPQMPNQPMQLNPAYGHDKLAIASLVLGIISLPASILTIFTMPIPVTGIVLGIISLKNKKSFAIAGITLSVIGIILSAALLVWGMNITNKKADNPGGLPNNGSITNPTINTKCYSFTLPEAFTIKDVLDNSDCDQTVVNTTSTDDLLIKASKASSDYSGSTKDQYLKYVANAMIKELGSKVQVTSSDYVTFAGSRAYQVNGTESSTNYKYFGFLVVISPKEYTTSTGEKLNGFMIVYDSATSKDMIDNLAKSWKWN